MKQTIIEFENAKSFERLEEDQLADIKGGSWWDWFWDWWESQHQGCPPQDDEDE